MIGDIVGDISLIACKSDYTCIEIKIKVKPDFEYIKKNCFKLSERLLSEKGDNIEWNFSSYTLDLNEMCVE